MTLLTLATSVALKLLTRVAAVDGRLWHDGQGAHTRAPAWLLFEVENSALRRIGNRLAQPAVLELKVLQAFHLLGLQPTKLRRHR
jgi:hypothetical protein